MAELLEATLTPSKLDLIADWIGKQRWFAGTGAPPNLTRVDSWRLDDPAGEVGIETLIVADRSEATARVYQVPLTYRGAPLDGAQDALVGTMEHSVLGRRWVYDAPHDPVYAAQLLRVAQGRASAQHGSISNTADESVAANPHGGWDGPDESLTSRVATGEQSNTSIIYTTAGPAGDERALIAKIFRLLSPGSNPDVVLAGALAAAGSPHVPAAVASLRGRWVDPASGQPSDQGVDLAVITRFLPEARDAWDAAVRDAANGASFEDGARELGAAVAAVHDHLAQALGSSPAEPSEVANALEAMQARLDAAAELDPSIAERKEAVRAVYARAADAPWPRTQRIHGDLHLGQVLEDPGGGWVLLDFEGEPLRDLAERSRPDFAVRDVAAMLRSFDYAGAASGADPQAVRAWVDAAQSAFLGGYLGARLEDGDASAALIDAFTLDRAIYEATYESRFRPEWSHIPAAAVAGLTVPPVKESAP